MISTVGSFATPLTTRDLPRADDLLAQVERRSVLAWGEHCTECLWPSCYADCSLYTPREDLLCRRFTNGIEWPEASTRATRSMRLQFRRLGKLEAAGTVRLGTWRAAVAKQRRNRLAEQAVAHLPLNLRHRSRQTFEAIDSRLSGAPEAVVQSDVFLMIVTNAAATPLRCTLTVKPRRGTHTKLFQTGLILPPGESRHAISAGEIMRFVDLADEVLVQFEPDAEGTAAPLDFAFMDFARLAAGTLKAEPAPVASPIASLAAAAAATAGAAKAKCVVWDLDNTAWRGTLIEDGLEALKLDPLAVAAIVELDRRGILQSVASKNNRDEAVAALAHFGLSDYFLFPQISWDPKSVALADIAKSLNIGIDTFVFVDDQPFERAEVQAALPAVTVLDAADIPDLTAMGCFDVPVTDESRRRRRMYQEEQQRVVAHAGHATEDFYDFLRDCMITLNVRRLDRSSFVRVQELAQRTNQLNYSGRRLSDSELNDLVDSDGPLVGLVLSASDRFGDYGIIGFAVVDQTSWTVRDFFMSCRVQRKTVEHAFFALLQKRAAAAGADTVHVTYQPTKRNMPARQALQEMNLATAPVLTEAEGLSDYLISVAVRIPHADIVSVVALW